MTAPILTFDVLPLSLIPAQLTAERLDEEIECLRDIVAKATPTSRLHQIASRDLAACLAEYETRNTAALVGTAWRNGLI